LCTVVPLLGLSLFLGFYPKPVFDRLEVAVDDLMTHIEETTGYEEPATPSPEPVEARTDETVNGSEEGH
jgi:hypothetical protein